MAKGTCYTDLTGVHVEVNRVVISESCSEVYASGGSSVRVPRSA